MDLSSLKEIGLTDGEVKVYLSLLRIGPVKTGVLAVSAGVSSSKVYKILSRLEKKGLASHGLKNGVAHYSALEPKRLLDYIDEERERLDGKRALVEKLLPSLMKQRKDSAKPQATVYYGFKAVSNFFRGILDELSEGDHYHVIGAGYPGEYGEYEETYRFFYKYHQLRAEKKIKVFMLANNAIRETMVPTTRLNAEIRFLPDFLMTSLQVLFYGNKTFFIIRAEEPFGFLIESKEVVSSFKKYFDAFWKMASK